MIVGDEMHRYAILICHFSQLIAAECKRPDAVIIQAAHSEHLARELSGGGGITVVAD